MEDFLRVTVSDEGERGRGPLPLKGLFVQPPGEVVTHVRGKATILVVRASGEGGKGAFEVMAGARREGCTFEGVQNVLSSKAGR